VQGCDGSASVQEGARLTSLKREHEQYTSNLVLTRYSLQEWMDPTADLPYRSIRKAMSVPAEHGATASIAAALGGHIAVGRVLALPIVRHMEVYSCKPKV
jgi:hypothetical protein